MLHEASGKGRAFILYYRQPEQKYRTKIGAEQGESLVIKARQINELGLDSLPLRNGHAIIAFDDMIEHGYYLMVLATEYELLKNSGQDLTAVENELYYALNAVNRVDRDAELYLSGGTVDESLNGFFLRDDFPPNFIENFQDEGFAYIRTDYSHVNLVNDYDPAAVHPGYSHELLPDYDYDDTANEASKDQISTLLMSTPLS